MAPLVAKIRGIFEHPKRSGRWFALYQDAEGKQRRRLGGTKQQAEALYNSLRGKPHIGRRRVVLTFRELGLEMLASSQHRNRQSTHKADLQRFERLCSICGQDRASSFTFARVQRILDELRAGGLAGSTANRYRSLLSTIFNYGVKAERVAANPVREVARYKEASSRVRWLLEDEETAIRAAIEPNRPDLQAEMTLALNTGLRQSELYNVRWKNVHGDFLYCHGKSGNEQERVTVNAAAREALAVLRRHSGDGVGIVKGSTCDSNKRDGRRWFATAVKRAGVENFRYHDLRHTYASRLAMKDTALLVIKDLMRHSSVKLTERYAHLMPGHAARAAEKIGGKK
jgi:integrase